ncbi:MULTISPECIES: zinc ribbon domain-containing protein [unclassified Microcoleus]|uniref:zinc ribbon domain-containing protein n=1 Tax=unclassified Microcoleus TaxID=2642155 RepID=UPI004040BBBC
MMQLGISLLFGLQYFGKIYGKTVIAVAPVYTSQDCSTCGNNDLYSLVATKQRYSLSSSHMRYSWA